MPQQLQVEAASATRIPRERLLRPQELAAHLNTSLRSVYDYVRAKKIPVIRITEKSMRFRLSDVERALARFTIKEVGE